MDIFKFNVDPNHAYAKDFLGLGEMINGIKTTTWVERYRDPGEFTITGDVSSGLRTTVPINSLISHLDTKEVMIVENHEIDEDVDEGEPQITITGRSLDSWLEQRCYNNNVPGGVTPPATLGDLHWASDSPRDQAVGILNFLFHIPITTPPPSWPISLNLNYITAVAAEEHVHANAIAARTFPRGELHKIIIDLIAIDDYGIRTIRPNPGDPDPERTYFVIHNGFDRSNSVIFSHAAGDLNKAKYLWSNKSYKNAAYVVSTYNEDVLITGSFSSLNARVLYVDGKDLDSQISPPPTGVPQQDVRALMLTRAQDAITAAKETSIISADISTNTKYKFRTDYDVGDIVTVQGNYDVTSIMRVTEHVEFQDENGESGYPTLSAVEE